MSKRDTWETPAYIFDPINERAKFTLDACAIESTAKCRKFFTPEQNGLEQSWADERVWCNPPYSNIGPWLQKAHEETQKSASTVVVALVPPWTDTKWWHDYATRAQICVLLKGRVQFLMDGKPHSGNQHPSCLLVYYRQPVILGQHKTTFGYWEPQRSKP